MFTKLYIYDFIFLVVIHLFGSMWFFFSGSESMQVLIIVCLHVYICVLF
jgi:hypothetical protein